MRQLLGTSIAMLVFAVLLVPEFQTSAQAQQLIAQPPAQLPVPGPVLNSLTIRLDWYDAGDMYIGHSTVFSESDTARHSWALASGQATAPLNATYISVYLDYFGVMTSCMEVDDVSLIGLVPDSSTVGEILSNGGFESGDFSDWLGVSTGGVPATVLSGSAHSGTYYARTGQFLYTEHYKIVPSTTYSMNAWYKTISLFQYQYLPLVGRE